MRREVIVVLSLFLTAAGLSRLSADVTEENRPLHNQESSWLRQRAQGDVFTWRMGDYAQQHAATGDVKKLGKQMVENYQADLKEIQKIAKGHGLALDVPKGLTPPQQATYDNMVAKRGIDFDKAYVKLLVSGRSANVTMLRISRSASTPANWRRLLIKISRNPAMLKSRFGSKRQEGHR